jgi:pilus assembly protein CpaB
MSRRIGIGIAALLLAVVGTVAVLAYARGADQRALKGQQAVSAYIVRKDVPAGTTVHDAVSKGLIVKELVASKGVPEGAMTSVSGTDQLVATTDLVPGEVVLSSVFGTQAAVNGQILVPAGKMAVSVALDDAAHVGQFLAVGGHVAIFDTFNVREKTPGLTPAGDHVADQHPYVRATRVLVPDVVVLAVGDTSVAPSSTSKSNSTSSSGTQLASDNSPTGTELVTLAVTQDEAARIIHAERTGTMTFALLSSGTTATPSGGISDPNLFTGIKP